MIAIFLVIAPVFLILGAGFAAVRAGYLAHSVAEGLNAFTVKLALPTLLFLAMYRLDFARAFDPGLLVAFYAGSLLSFVLAISLSRVLAKRRPGEAVAAGFSAMFSNLVLLGLPIVERAFGKEALTPAYGIIALHAPLLYVTGIATMEMSRRDKKGLAQTAASAMRAILGNALMIGIAAGAACNLAGLRLPAPVEAAAGMLAAAAIPAALVGIGAALTQYRVREDWREGLMICALALVLHPAVAFVLSHHVFGLPAEQVRVATLLAAMPPGMNIYVFAVMYQRAEALAASALLMATAFSVGTIAIWLAVLKAVTG